MIMNRERPVSFSGAMARAILFGAKTQTRRVIRAPRGHYCEVRDVGGILRVEADREPDMEGGNWYDLDCPHGEPGDRLWVRETFYCDDYRYPAVPVAELADPSWRDGNLYYRADVASGRFEDAGYWAEPGGKWTPSIFMPRWASRITLEIASVRVERLTSISEEDAREEGCWGGVPWLYEDEAARTEFRHEWDSLAPEGSRWADDPWVWAIGFRRIA